MTILSPRKRNECYSRFMIFGKVVAISGLVLGLVTASEGGVPGVPSSAQAMTASSLNTVTMPLPDTGITANQCYQAGSDVLVSCTSAAAIALNANQDGMVGRDVTESVHGDGKLGFSYSEVSGGCVKDNVSGLIWEIKTTDGGLRDRYKSYTNIGDGRDGDASAYVTAVNAARLCGYSDWRLPTADELQGIVDYGVPDPGPTIDATWFPNTAGKVYWSSSPYLGYPAKIRSNWVVFFSVGYIHIEDLRNALSVRLVR